MAPHPNPQDPPSATELEEAAAMLNYYKDTHKDTNYASFVLPSAAELAILIRGKWVAESGGYTGVWVYRYELDNQY